MVKLIAGEKGSGKSKKLIKIANEEIKTNNGNIVFLDNSDRNIFDLNHDIRFIDVSEYNVDTLDGFIGF
ncbi:MAG: twitching motility protein PilT, partial [Bacillota bacterium]|nr:twitching motility protein PilT [Bacillota bacterium]